MKTNIRTALVAASTIVTAVACGGKEPLGAFGDSDAGVVGAPGTGGGPGGAGGTGGTGGAAASSSLPGVTISGGSALLAAKHQGVSSIDLLFMIDNSSSMADKQTVLRGAIPQLVKRLVNPGCVRPDGSYDSDYVAAAGCPAGTTRDFAPVTDIHIGIISSSLGGHGAGVCPAVDPTRPDAKNADMAHLLTRGAATSPAAGFLAWDGAITMTMDALTTTLQSMVSGVGENGCGYEASLESIYRFLSDPEPYLTITLDAVHNAILTGVDTQLLAQRADFLRPDSLVVVVAVTDDDDCSIWDGNQTWVVLEPPPAPGTYSLLKRGTQQCAVNPNDSCCQSCSQATKPGCPDISADPNCQKGVLTAAEDPQNLRCFHQKQRYGYDFLFPVQRYISALKGEQVPNRTGALVTNPLFQDLSTACTAQNNCRAARDPSNVFFAGIVGVPWQDVAKDPANLAAGFKAAASVDWPLIVGVPSDNVPPTDPLMIQSIAPRQGIGIAPPNSGPNANPVNGHEWDPSLDIPANADLQYACVFPLPTPRDCSSASAACDCNGTPATRFNPLCQNAAGQYSTTQVRAKAYPSTRPLQVLQGLGDQGVVASICPADLTAANQNQPQYGYNPAANAIVDRMRAKLRGSCLPVSLAPQNGTVACAVIEGFIPAGNQACDCNGDPHYPGRTTVPDSLITPEMIQQFTCICQVNQLTGSQLTSCQRDVTMPAGADGWCYVDPAIGGAGSCDVVKNCGPTEKRIIRFSPSTEPRPGATAILSCDPKVVLPPPGVATTCP